MTISHSDQHPHLSICVLMCVCVYVGFFFVSAADVVVVGGGGGGTQQHYPGT